MIFGIGIDVLEAARVHKVYERHGEHFVERLLMPAERAQLALTKRKERFLAKYRDALDVPFIMGVGGSFDVLAGKVNRAPSWMQRAGLEWAYRLLQEPGRMWRRYLSTNLAYAGLLLGVLGRRIFRRPSA